MGINTAWKPILENTFGYLYVESIPPDTTIDVIIDDFSLNFRKVLWGLNNWSELIDRLKSRITSKINPNLKQYVILFDEPLYVPRSKQCTQKKRLNESVHRGVTPFSDTEIEFINIGENVIIPDSSEDSNLFINRLMMTRKLFPQLISFCCQKIISICPTIPYPIQFIIDGGYTNDINFDDLQINLIVDENCVLNLTDEPKFITINNTNQDKSIHISEWPKETSKIDSQNIRDWKILKNDISIIRQRKSKKRFPLNYIVKEYKTPNFNIINKYKEDFMSVSGALYIKSSKSFKVEFPKDGTKQNIK